MDLLMIIVGLVLRTVGNKNQQKNLKVTGEVVAVIGLILFTLGAIRSCTSAMP